VIRELRIHRRATENLADLAGLLNPKVRV